MSDISPQEHDRRLNMYWALREKLHALYDHDQFAIHDKVIEFHDRLKAKYENFRDHRLYHLVSGSTVKSVYGHFDFPPPDSVEHFINSEYENVFGLVGVA